MTKKMMTDIFFNVDVQNLEKFHEVPNDLPFLPERIKIQKVEKSVANLKQALNNGLVLKRVHRVIKKN